MPGSIEKHIPSLTTKSLPPTICGNSWQLSAQEAVKPGITCGELDKIARDVIESHGYGEYFNHGK
jgi:hypothetical protein